MNQDFSEPSVFSEVRGELGMITLSNPASLNALSLEMIRQITTVLDQWEGNDAMQAVYFKGEGERAFCSGGDVKSFYRSGMDFRRGLVDRRIPALFFGEEYNMNKRLFHYPKPVIAFMDGITMGGGYGIAGNCKYPIATDNTVFAMPEVGIGLFPDVGSVYHLLKCPQNIGYYLALTGRAVKAGDMVRAGLACCYISADKEKDLIDAIAGGKDIQETLESLASGVQEETFSSRADDIERIFEKPVTDILDALAAESSGWAQDTLTLLKSRSPSSVLVTREYMNRCRGKTFDEVIETDFFLAQRFVERLDLYEGIRAAILDKDKNPQWSPANFEDVLPADIESYFQTTDYTLSNVRRASA